MTVLQCTAVTFKCANYVLESMGDGESQAPALGRLRYETDAMVAGDCVHLDCVEIVAIVLVGGEAEAIPRAQVSRVRHCQARVGLPAGACHFPCRLLGHQMNVVCCVRVGRGE